jgi:small-conductance mechanosensitive channel
VGLCSDGLRTRCGSLYCLWWIRYVVRIEFASNETTTNFLSSGFQLWKVFMAMDSDRYPMKSYADCFFRVYGRWARHGVNILQAIQLLFTVSILILSNGQSISQVSKGSICFIACLVIFMAAGMVVGQIRTLQRFGWLANFAVWINLLILFIV